MPNRPKTYGLENPRIFFEGVHFCDGAMKAGVLKTLYL